ncbi:hypothetical protein E4U19_004416 [Claviceps sp. Clav32 group G5]|nr:hypothetical protein E4U19_004416 [Claviceps sp. Clav32 group G5]KAG6049163.1 hypothetical protein E4U39_006499 [Claviceps sp. Clav50 group G5]
MEDPAQAWPAWKFGMKRDDLFTTLHDQYNTFSYTLQDPDAFHHDVYEISHDADTVDEFHRLMADRRQLRLRELRESLETLAVEIIANPKLMATEQWDAAVQLFRTKSYDSIVRYFASYIPHDYFDRHDTNDAHKTHSIKTSATSKSSIPEADTFSTTDSRVDQGPLLFAGDACYAHDLDITCEPDSFMDEGGHGLRLCEPMSPSHSEAATSDTFASSPPSDADSTDFSTNPSSRSMSFCDCESGPLVRDLIRQSCVETGCDALIYDACDTPKTSVCDIVQSHSPLDRNCEYKHPQHDVRVSFDFGDDDFPTTQNPDDDLNCVDYVPNSHVQDTPDSQFYMSRPEVQTASCSESLHFISKKILSLRRTSSSPRSLVDSRHRRASSPLRDIGRSPEEASSKIQKYGHDFTKKRRKPMRKD